MVQKKYEVRRDIFITGAVLGFLGIMIGAFAAHGLKPLISTDAQVTFETGVRYQMYAVFFLFILGVLPAIKEKTKTICFYLTLVGVVLFSGSIYGLATNSLTSFDFTAIALITPLGGTLMIAAWAVLAVSFIKLKNK